MNVRPYTNERMADEVNTKPYANERMVDEVNERPYTNERMVDEVSAKTIHKLKNKLLKTVIERKKENMKINYNEKNN